MNDDGGRWFLVLNNRRGAEPRSPGERALLGWEITRPPWPARWIDEGTHKNVNRSGARYGGPGCRCGAGRRE